MATCNEVPRYELISKKKCPPAEEKYHQYLFETLNKKPKNNLVEETPYNPVVPETSKVFYGQTQSNYPNAGYNSTVNYYNYSNAFTGFNRLPKQTELEFGMPIEDENAVNNPSLNFEKFKTEETFGLNTLQAFDKNLEELKRENKEFKKFKGKNKNPSRKYISQEEIKRQKEIIFGSIDDLQKYLQNKKNKGANWFKRFIKLSEEKGIHLCDLIEAKTPEELEKLIKEILKKEEESQKEYKTNAQSKKDVFSDKIKRKFTYRSKRASEELENKEKEKIINNTKDENKNKKDIRNNNKIFINDFFGNIR